LDNLFILHNNLIYQIISFSATKRQPN